MPDDAMPDVDPLDAWFSGFLAGDRNDMMQRHQYERFVAGELSEKELVEERLLQLRDDRVELDDSLAEDLHSYGGHLDSSLLSPVPTVADDQWSRMSRERKASFRSAVETYREASAEQDRLEVKQAVEQARRMPWWTIPAAIVFLLVVLGALILPGGGEDGDGDEVSAGPDEQQTDSADGGESPAGGEAGDGSSDAVGAALAAARPATEQFGLAVSDETLELFGDTTGGIGQRILDSGIDVRAGPSKDGAVLIFGGGPDAPLTGIFHATGDGGATWEDNVRKARGEALDADSQVIGDTVVTPDGRIEFKVVDTRHSGETSEIDVIGFLPEEIAEWWFGAKPSGPSPTVLESATLEVDGDELVVRGVVTGEGAAGGAITVRIEREPPDEPIDVGTLVDGDGSFELRLPLPPGGTSGLVVTVVKDQHVLDTLTGKKDLEGG